MIPGHPQRRMAVWWGCVRYPCHGRRYAVLVTRDGFRSRHLLPVSARRYWFVEPAGSTHFAISTGGRRRLVGLDGSITKLDVGGAPSPLAGDEVPLRDRRGFLGVDPGTGRAHPLSVPAHVVQVQSGPGERLSAFTLPQGGRSSYLWSDDDGATWTRHDLDGGDSNELPQLVPTTSDRIHALALGGDGATLFPLDFLEISRDGGSSFRTYAVSDRPKAYGEPLALQPDGRLLVSVDAWSDARPHRPSPHPLGLYTLRPGQGLAAVPSAPPFAGREPGLSPLVLDTVVWHRRVDVYAVTSASGRGLEVSTDGGRTWRSERAR